MCTYTVNDNQHQCKQDLTPQFFDAPDILKCLELISSRKLKDLIALNKKDAC